MWTLAKCQLVIFSTVFLANCVNAQDEGSRCNHKIKGVPGICKRLNQCPTAIQEIQQSIYPQNCGFIGTATLVCCVEKTNAPAKPLATSTFKTPTGHLPVGEKSRQACQNYKVIAYKQEARVTLSNDDEADYDLVENCPWEYEGTAVIYEGTKSEEAEFPHMALIGYGSYPHKYDWKCGGSLVSEKFVLTAAHCMRARTFGAAKFVRLGDLDYASTVDDKFVQQINIKNRIKHPLHKPPQRYHDIALLELERPATLNLHVKPICLYTLDPTGKQKDGIVTGWGVTEHGKSSNMLLKATVQYFPTERCQITFEDDSMTLPRGIDAKIQLCYGPYDNKTDTCQGDSGGPIQMYSRDVFCSYYIFGITSFGKGCGHTKIPAGYVNLYSYIEWIEGIVWP